MIDIEQLLAPVCGERPCGEDLAFSPELDAIAQARRADDPSLAQGAWVTELKEADWQFVASRCAQLIEQRSKDLQLAVWLAEASARTGGLRGLADSLLVLAGLCQRYWDELYPLPEDGSFEQRAGNLCWIAARIPQLIGAMPVAEGSIDALLRDCDHCSAALTDLEHEVDERLGPDGPSFTAAKKALQGLIDKVTPVAREKGVRRQTPRARQPGAEPPQQDQSLPALAGPIETRAQALAQLRMVAEFFRRTEPHSPVAYLAEKAAAWGEQPLHLWLRSVIKDDASLIRIEELLGVERQ